MSAKDKITKIVTDNIKKIVGEYLPQLIEEAVNECIYEVVDDEVSKYTDEKISSTLENISKVHGIPLDLLLRDMPECDKRGICKGVRGSKRCIFKGTHDGYCKFHKAQGERIKKRELPSVNLHTHGPEKMFVRGCPGCECSGSKELIDLGSLFGNE